MPLRIANLLEGLDRCPHCNVAVPLLKQEWGKTAKVQNRNEARAYAVYECSRCNRLTMVESRTFPLTADGKIPNGIGANEIETLYPKPAHVDASLPKDAQRYLKQAVDTVFAPDASVVMSASAVDAMLKAKGYEQGSLYTRIDQAVKGHVLTEGMGKWAHKVRLDANAVRHADDGIGPPSEKDARQVLEFASALGDFLFVFTARVDEGIKDAEANVE